MLKNLVLVMLVSTMMTIAAMVGFLYGALENGIITVAKDEQEHNRVVMVDDHIVEENSWLETKGYQVNVNLNDGAYIEL